MLFLEDMQAFQNNMLVGFEVNLKECFCKFMNISPNIFVTYLVALLKFELLSFLLKGGFGTYHFFSVAM